MAELYPVSKHCALRAEAWSPSKVQAGARKILQHSIETFERGELWPRHPLDGDDPVGTGYYFGAGGVFWGVSLASREGGLDEPRGWFGAELSALAERNIRERPCFDLDSSRSYLFGDIPLLMLLYLHRRDRQLADQIFSRLEGSLAGPVHELMWGIAGCMLATLHMQVATAQQRWIDLYQRQASRLLAAAEQVPGVGFHWVDERRGKRFAGLGAVHGFAGNVVALLRGFPYLPEEAKSAVLLAVPQTLLATAVRVGGRANWPRSPGDGVPFRLYHCHGAPGIVTSLAAFPVGVSPAFDSLLLEAGELIDQAGALRKGPGLCHGTAGNGFALLKLYERTGDERWLSRARQFAMHALWQVECGRELFAQGRHSLWTGDIGTALFLNECLRGTARFPTIDVF